MRHLRKLAAVPAGRQRTDRQLLDDFAARRDDSAFADLVSRHGPMVLRVCRRVLRHEQDAEDAFQATFLVLARNTASIRKRQALTSWLYGVAYRTAMKAKRSAARRRNHEARLRERTPPATPGPSWDDVQAVLDEEIRHLPELYRTAFVLCVLEGKREAAAAAELGVKEGTLSCRLARARQRLQQQLARRGIELSVVLAALSVAQEAAKAAVPAELAAATIRFGLLVAAGEPAAGVIPSSVAALAAGVTRAMFLSKTKIATALVLAAGLLLAGAGALARQVLSAGEPPAESPKSAAGARKPEPAAAKEAAKPPAAEDKDALTYGGRVIGPDGQPVAGARLYVKGGSRRGEEFRRLEPSPVDTTGPDGRFRFTIPKAKSVFGAPDTIVTALAANYGAGWVRVPTGGKTDDLTLQLVKDDVPISGQIVDLEGKPVAGATLRVIEIRAAPGEDLGPWLAAARENGRSPREGLDARLESQYLPRSTTALSSRVTTDAAGRLRLTGIGRNRLVRAQLDGPAIASQRLCILTRPGKAIEVTQTKPRPAMSYPGTVTTYHGADFRLVTAPTKPVVGVVRDKDTKKPLAGVTIQSYWWGDRRVYPPDIVRTTTDEQGRYRLMGMSKGEGNQVRLLPRDDQPYLAVHEAVPNTDGLDPVTVDFEVKRGVWIEGKLTDKVTGQPVQGEMGYFALQSNPNLRDYPGFEHCQVAAKEDGSYRVVGLPGPGLVAVRCQKDHYLWATEREDEYGTRERYLATAPFGIFFPTADVAFARIDPAAGTQAVKRDVTLDPGWTFTFTVLGPDGKPLPGARSFNTNCEMKGAEFTVRGCDPRGPREVLFQHPERGLFGVAQLPKEKGGSVVVRMTPGVTLTGRLVDAEGKPRAGVELEASSLVTGPEDPHMQDLSYSRTRTDREGRFRLEAVLPRYLFRLSDGRDAPFFDGVPEGRTTDLGDVHLQR
jgi:RNA polymerase sigma factor (sigma-70 family)